MRTTYLFLLDDALGFVVGILVFVFDIGGGIVRVVFLPRLVLLCRIVIVILFAILFAFVFAILFVFVLVVRRLHGIFLFLHNRGGIHLLGRFFFPFFGTAIVGGVVLVLESVVGQVRRTEVELRLLGQHHPNSLEAAAVVVAVVAFRQINDGHLPRPNRPHTNQERQQAHHCTRTRRRRGGGGPAESVPPPKGIRHRGRRQ
mmetsp:Transcript_19607/g.54724  ORF Transcript_19607/g.54724 Transcript_19607/m.54724 type:complete len:201 (+) Transcript_19607:159-761(+)